MKKYKNRFGYLTLSVLITSLIVCSVFQSCEKEEFSNLQFDKEEFLFINGDLKSPATLIVPENWKIYYEAYQRILQVTTYNNGNILINAESGVDLNMEENLFKNISNHLEKVIKEDKALIIKEKGINILAGRNIDSDLVRLKSGGTEGDLLLGGISATQIANNVLVGMQSYSQSHSSIFEIWDLSSGNTITGINSGEFSWNGNTYTWGVMNGCINATSYNCELNNISTAYSAQDAAGYWFIIDNIMGLPSATIHTTSYAGYVAMKNYLNSQHYNGW